MRNKYGMFWGILKLIRNSLKADGRCFLHIFFDSEIFSLFYKICYNIKVIKEGYHEAKVFTDDDAISRN